MGYIVKATSASGVKMWISLPTHTRHRAFGPRDQAEVFRTQKEAQSVVETIADQLRRVGSAIALKTLSCCFLRAATMLRVQ